MPGHYETAQICLNGHVITPNVESFEKGLEDFCHQCGKKTITKCPKCKSRIRGAFRRNDMNILIDYNPPSFCIKCARKFPWTLSKLRAARKLTDQIANLSKEEKEALKNTLKDIIRDTPKTNSAANTFKKIIQKIGADAARSFKSILISIATQEARDLIWGSHSN